MGRGRGADDIFYGEDLAALPEIAFADAEEMLPWSTIERLAERLLARKDNYFQDTRIASRGNLGRDGIFLLASPNAVSASGNRFSVEIIMQKEEPVLSLGLYREDDGSEVGGKLYTGHSFEHLVNSIEFFSSGGEMADCFPMDRQELADEIRKVADMVAQAL